MSQTVWHFEGPTIRWCTVHESVDFTYSPNNGLRCRANIADTEKDCDEHCWVDFSLEPGLLEEADARGESHNTWAYCGGCQTSMREHELVAKLCADCREDTE